MKSEVSYFKVATIRFQMVVYLVVEFLEEKSVAVVPEM